MFPRNDGSPIRSMEERTVYENEWTRFDLRAENVRVVKDSWTFPLSYLIGLKGNRIYDAWVDAFISEENDLDRDLLHEEARQRFYREHLPGVVYLDLGDESVEIRSTRSDRYSLEDVVIKDRSPPRKESAYALVIEVPQVRGEPRKMVSFHFRRKDEAMMVRNHLLKDPFLLKDAEFLKRRGVNSNETGE